MDIEDYKFRRSALFPVLYLMIGLSIWFFYNSIQSYKTVSHVTGLILNKGIQKEKHRGNYTFYFLVDKSKQYFGIFLGAGNKAIKDGEYYNKLLKIGEPVTVYYDNNPITRFENLTRLIYRLDYKGKTIIEANRKGQLIAGLITSGIALFFILGLYWLKKKYNRELLIEK